QQRPCRQRFDDEQQKGTQKQRRGKQKGDGARWFCWYHEGAAILARPPRATAPRRPSSTTTTLYGVDERRQPSRLGCVAIAVVAHSGEPVAFGRLNVPRTDVKVF